jgi:hypothetical protein
VAALVAWKLGLSSGTARTFTTVAHRLEEFPTCAAAMREGRLSLDQVGVIAARAGQGSDEHYAQLAAVATVSQLRTAVKLEPRPDPAPRPQPPASITKTGDEQSVCWRITLPLLQAAKFDAALAAHRDALITEWKHDHDDTEDASEVERPPFPTTADAFMRLVETSWDAEAARRPHAAHTTVVVHVDVEARAAALHLGPLLTDAERQYLTCDATCEVWFERDGQPIGAGRKHPHHQSAVAPRAGAPRRHMCGARVWGDPWFACSSSSALGRRRPDRVGQPGAAVPPSSSVASPR